jgi:hypothetical protein
MVIGVFKGAQIARLPVILGCGHPQDIMEEPEGLFEFRGEEFD